MIELIIVIVIILAFWYYQQTLITEKYTQCFTCDDDYRMLDGGMVVSNPYIWPYSGTRDVPRIYQLGDQYKGGFGFRQEPMIHQTVPDHVIMM